MWELWEFIVSGRVPGSTIEVTFELWLRVMAIVAASVVAIRLIAWLNRRRMVKSLIDAPQLSETAAS